MPVHSLLIGINYERSANPLKWAVNDAKTLHNLFQANYDGESKLLIEEQATSAGILDALKKLRNLANDESTIIVHFSGHGSRIPEPCLVTYGWRKGEVNAETCIPLHELRELIGQFASLRTVFLIDACYSGQIAAFRDLDGINVRTVPIDAGIASQAPNDGVHSYFSNWGAGKIVITASSENEVAIEHAEIEHGVFTQFLIKALLCESSIGQGNGMISIPYEAYRYIEKEVSRHIRSVTSGKYAQNPMQYSTIRGDITLPCLEYFERQSLVNFPTEFCPLTIVVGDRREIDPKKPGNVLPRTPGDFLAITASASDLRWIFSLNLPSNTEIISDKIFVNAPYEYLVNEFGDKNLLVVGSPAANHLARIVNDTALFWFNIKSHIREETREMMAEILKIGADGPRLQQYADDSNVQEKNRHYINQHKQPGFVDLTYSLLERGFHRPQSRDYGVISLCKHPYSTIGKVAILAAGVGLPATMQAIKMLATPKSYFKSHPMGGIFSVTIEEGTWWQKMERATPDWSTERYTLENLQNAFHKLRESQRDLGKLQIRADDVSPRIELIEQIKQKDAD